MWLNADKLEKKNKKLEKKTPQQLILSDFWDFSKSVLNVSTGRLSLPSPRGQ